MHKLRQTKELTNLRKFTLFFVLCCSLLLPLTTFAQRGSRAVPEGANLERYPLSNHILTTKEQAELSLRPMVIEQPWTGYNWYQGKQRFVLETLPAGTLVLADTNGKLIYKADCGNRLVEIPTCPKCLATMPVTTPPVQQPRNFLDRLWNAVRDFWRFLGGVILLLLGLLVLLGLLYLLYRLLRRLFEGLQAPPTTPTPATRTTESGTSRATPSAPPIVMPVDVPSQRRFVTCYPGGPTEQTKVVSGGCKEVHVEQSLKGDDWLTTIRLR